VVLVNLAAPLDARCSVSGFSIPDISLWNSSPGCAARELAGWTLEYFRWMIAGLATLILR